MDYLLGIEQVNRAVGFFCLVGFLKFFFYKEIVPNSDSFTLHYFVLPVKEFASYILAFLLFCHRNIWCQVLNLKDYHLPPLERLGLI